MTYPKQKRRTPFVPRSTSWRAAAMCIALAIVGGAVGLLVSATAAASYRTSEPVLIQTWSVDALILGNQNTALTSQDVADAAVVATSERVLTQAVTLLGEPGLTPTDLQGNVSASASQTNHFITIEAIGSTRGQSAARLAAVANAFSAASREKVLGPAQRLVDAPANVSGATVSAEARLRAEVILDTIQPVTLYSAGVPEKTGSSPAVNTVAGAVVGLAVGALIVILFSFAPPRAQSASGTSRQLNTPSMDWDSGHGPTSNSALSVELKLLAANGLVVLCPLDDSNYDDAENVRLWLERPDLAIADHPQPSERDRNSREVRSSESHVGHRPIPASASTGIDSSASMGTAHDGSHSTGTGFVTVAPAGSGLAASRPAAELVSALVVVGTAGRHVDEVRRGMDSLSVWRRVDAVVLMDGRR